MLLVIFGAGASFDSVPHLPASLAHDPRVRAVVEDRLPLANQLFDDRREFVAVMEQFRDCMALVPILRVPGVAVERELAKIQEQQGSFPRAHQELMAVRFYLQVAIWRCQKRWYAHHRGITNYATLLREIERWRYSAHEHVCFVSFNYDTMIEQSMAQVLGLQVTGMDSYITWDNYTLIKLHGSISWGRELEESAQNSYNHQRMILDAAKLKISSRYVLVNNTFDVIVGQAPALAIPVDRKDEFSCPENHVVKLIDTLPKVTKILIVGWRGTEAEFMNLLRTRLNGFVDLMIISGDQAGAEESYANFPYRNFRYIGQNRLTSGFSGVISNLDLVNVFLRNPRPSA